MQTFIATNISWFTVIMKADYVATNNLHYFIIIRNYDCEVCLDR